MDTTWCHLLFTPPADFQDTLRGTSSSSSFLKVFLFQSSPLGRTSAPTSTLPGAPQKPILLWPESMPSGG